MTSPAVSSTQRRPVARTTPVPVPENAKAKAAKTAAPVSHGGGCPDCQGTEFIPAGAPKAASATATVTPQADAKVKAWVKGTFKELVDRAPTAQELEACTKAIHNMVAEGKHVFTAGAAIVNLIKAGEEFKTKHPFAPFFDRAYQTHVGRTPNMEELKKAEAYVKDTVAKGTHLFEALNHTKFFLKIGEEGKAYAAAHPTAEWVQNAFFDNIGRAATGEELAGSEQIFAKAGHPWAAGAFVTALLRQKPEFGQKFPLGPWINETYNKELGRMPSVEELTKGSEFMDGLMKQGKHVFEAGAAFVYVLRLGEEWQKRNAAPAGQVGQPTGPGKVVNGYVNGAARQITVVPVGDGEFMRADAAGAFLRMKADAARAGVNLSATSGWRSMEEQQELYRRYLNGTGNLAARPGYSNHQGGVSMDIGGVGGYGTAAFRWLAANAGKYGYVNDVSGEYWHWTFRG